MRKTKLLTVDHNGKRLSFPAGALGGSPKEPKLKPADELLLKWAEERGLGSVEQGITLYHDREGILCTCVRAPEKHFVSNNFLHRQRMYASLERNGVVPAPVIGNLLQPGRSSTRINLLQVPKSLELFELYLRHAAQTAKPETHLACAFQTRHFTPRMLEIAAKYAAEVSQSRAYKKARLLMLSGFYTTDTPEIPLSETSFDGVVYRQYPGVFSAGHIDYATQFLLTEWATNGGLAELKPPAQILDAGCGNGIIGDYLLGRYPAAQLVAYDVARVAVASTRLNLEAHGYANRSTVLQAGAISKIREPSHFDLIVTNPPFHDEFQTDISASTDLFLAASDRLNTGGHLVVVANRHLNYATHLRRYFDEVLVVAENEKFVIYRSK